MHTTELKGISKIIGWLTIGLAQQSLKLRLGDFRLHLPVCTTIDHFRCNIKHFTCFVEFLHGENESVDGGCWMRRHNSFLLIELCDRYYINVYLRSSIFFFILTKSD